MRSYKKIMPLLLTVALLGSMAYSIKSKWELQKEYETALEDARSLYQKGIIVDAFDRYQDALAIQPSLAGYLEAGEMFLEAGNYTSAKRWYDRTLLELYPKEAETYLYGLRVYAANGNYNELFSVYDAYQDRNLQSAEVDEFIEKYLYVYSLIGEFSDVGVFNPVSGCAAVKYEDHWGYIRKDGERQLPYIYAEAGMLEDYAPVIDENGSAFYIDAEGNEKINENFILEKDPAFGAVSEFQNIESGLALAYNGEVWNYYDIETFEMRFGGFRDALPTPNGIGAVSMNGTKWAIIDHNGTPLTDYVYDEVLADGKSVSSRNGILLVRMGREYFQIDTAGNPIGTARYSGAKAYHDTTWAAVKKNGRWLFIDHEGGEHDLGNFEDAESFSNGLAAVKQNGLWGYIDVTGNMVIENVFYGAGPYQSGGIAFVESTPGTWQLLTLFRYNHS